MVGETNNVSENRANPGSEGINKCGGVGFWVDGDKTRIPKKEILRLRLRY